jgi:iron(III) transport system substrate-binding protein
MTDRYTWLTAAGAVDRRAFLKVLGLGGAGAFLAACRPSPSAAPRTAPIPPQAATSAAAEWERRWSELIEAARKEGTVVVSGPPTPDTRAEFTTVFRNRFGINLEYLGGRTGELIARLKAERAAGVYTVDAILGGAQSLYLEGYPDKMFEPLAPALIHPEATDPTKWVAGRVWFMDPEQQYILRLTNFSTLLVSVNTQYVRAEEIRTWADLLDPKFRGKISTDDPTVAGSGWNTASFLLRYLGEDYTRRLFQDQQPAISRDYSQMTEWLARGTYPISLGVVADRIQNLKADGFPIELVLTTSTEVPGMVTAGSGMGVLLNNAPHPNAAKLFLNWVAMKEGNEVWNRTQAQASVRTDVDNAWAPDYIVPKPGAPYFDAYEWDYVLKSRSPEETERMRRILGRPS